jgi:hypothetical protein
MLKNCLLFYLAVILPFFTVAQKDDFGKISLAVVMPQSLDDVDYNQLSKLETKITQIISSAGLTANGYTTNFVIYPKFSIYESDVVEGGMQNITVVTTELTLFIKQVDNNIIFSSLSVQLKGSGTTKEKAVTNAISNIKTESEEYKKFVNEGKGKIIGYYNAKCQDILTQIDNLVKMKNYDQAMALLLSVPEEATECYTKTQTKAIEVYKLYQSNNCEKQLLAAKAYIASNNYVSALNTLMLIDPATTCFKEAKTLVSSIEGKIDKDLKQEWDFKMKVYSDIVALDKLRIDSARQIAVSYYSNSRNTFLYKYIIR